MSNALMFLFPALVIIMLAMPLVPVYRNVISGKKAKNAIMFNLIGFFGICALSVILPVGDFVAFAAEGTASTAATVSVGAGMGYLAAALAAGLSSLGAGIAVASAAPAAIGATSEDSQSFGKSLIFVALGEGVALYGLLIAILIINNI